MKYILLCIVFELMVVTVSCSYNADCKTCNFGRKDDDSVRVESQMMRFDYTTWYSLKFLELLMLVFWKASQTKIAAKKNIIKSVKWSGYTSGICFISHVTKSNTYGITGWSIKYTAAPNKNILVRMENISDFSNGPMHWLQWTFYVPIFQIRKKS